jgi:hypothetical protein
MSKLKPEPTRRQRWLPYVRQIADTIGLRDWQVFIDEDTPREENIASCYPCEGRKIATVRFSESFLMSSPFKQRHAVVHELIHNHLAPYMYAVEKKTSNDPVLGMLMEYGVDGLADGFAHLLPLPKVK